MIYMCVFQPPSKNAFVTVLITILKLVALYRTSPPLVALDFQHNRHRRRKLGDLSSNPADVERS